MRNRRVYIAAAMTLLALSVIALIAISNLSVGTTKECGLPEIEPELTDLNIIGGREARPGSWPWHVGFYMKPYINIPPWNHGQHFCAGALIDEQTVVTAAHCLEMSPSKVQVHLGAHHRTTKDESEQIINVTHFCSYPQWISGNLHDIAIVRLERPVTYSPTISPICLPEKNDEVRIGDDEVYVTGWGYTSADWDAEQSEELYQAKQNIITKDQCVAMRYIDADRLICSTHELGSSCHGDSGGPLVLERDGHWQLQGVVSGGPPRCGTPDWPMYYTEVAKYRDWIDMYRSTVSGSDPRKRSGLCK